MLVAISSLLAASTNAQRCGEVTQAVLGSTDDFSTNGLIAERVGFAVQLSRFRIVCEATAGARDLYTEVSVVAEYTVEGSTLTQAQFEFSCITGNVWDTVDAFGFTVPPDIDNIIFAIRRRDCYKCVSPNSFNTSAPGNNHCLGIII